MSQTRDRLERLLDSESEACCAEDIDRRLADLETLKAETTADIEAESTFLDTLGNETRLALVRWLVAADRALCVCELEALASVSESAVSHALSDLTEGGLVTREKRGKWRYYGQTEQAERLIGLLDEMQLTGPTDGTANGETQ